MQLRPVNRSISRQEPLGRSNFAVKIGTNDLQVALVLGTKPLQLFESFYTGNTFGFPEMENDDLRRVPTNALCLRLPCVLLPPRPRAMEINMYLSYVSI